MEYLTGIGMALALGILVGIERGWHERDAEDGGRLAGIRTFALIGLLGGVTMLLADTVSPLLLPVGFAAMAVLLGVGYALQSRRDQSAGITTIVAALITFLLGALSVSGHAHTALPVAVVMSLLLGLKPRLHALIGQISETELLAVLKLLLISVVALPLIPNQGYGPWSAINPYEIWWMVVLIATLSSAGYFAMRLVGPDRGLLLTGVLGGLVSSTALTLSFSRLHQREPRLAAVLSGGIVLACAMMFPRVWIETVIVRPGMAPALLLPLATMMVAPLVVLLWLRPGTGDKPVEQGKPISNPFELRSALFMGLLLGAVMFLTSAGQAWLGDQGVFMVATVAAIADVDAITLAMARSAGDSVDFDVAKQAIVLSAAINTLVKGLIAGALGGRVMLRWVTLPLSIAAVAGLAIAFLV